MKFRGRAVAVPTRSARLHFESGDDELEKKNRRRNRKLDTLMVWPECMACEQGVLVPLSDFGGQGASVHYKAWVCTSPDCDYNIKIRNGEVHVNEPIFEGPRNR